MTVPMALLGILESTGSTHGFALKRRYDELLGRGTELKYGQVYGTLARLERDGLAKGLGLEKGGGADRRVYAITPDGVEELESWLGQPAPVSGRPSELFTRVVLAIVSGRSGEDVLMRHRTAYLARMRVITAARADVDVIGRLVGDFEMVHLEADLKWIELAGQRMASLVAEVGPEASR